MYFKYFLLVLVNLFVSAMNIFLAPIVVLFADKSGWLPKWLWWFQTPGDSLDGSRGWKNGKRWFKVEDNKFKRWVNRFAWLYRNSMYGFCIDVLGARTKDTDTLLIKGDPLTSNRPIHSGLITYVLLRNNKPVYFQWYYVKQWSKTRCIRINLGWKLWGYLENTNGNHQLTFSPNPLMGLS